QARPEQDLPRKTSTGPLADQPRNEGNTGEHRNKDRSILPPRHRLNVARVCDLTRGAAVRAHAGSSGDSQQPATVHPGSTHGALSSTARVVSTNAVNADVRCGSEIS